LVTPSTKLSHEYKESVTNTTASTKQRDHHQDSDSDNDDILSELSSPGNKKVPPFYPPIQGRSDDSPVTDNNPKTNIMELNLDNGDDLKYISQFRLSCEAVIDQKHHYPLLVYVQQLHNKIALLEHKISLNNSSISGYKDSSLATTVYT